MQGKDPSLMEQLLVDPLPGTCGYFSEKCSTCSSRVVGGERCLVDVR